MITTCTDCGATYDDAHRLTFCPHARFMSAANLEQKIAGIGLFGLDVRFAHQPNGPAHYVQSVSWNGMVTLADLPGEFAPHLFVINRG